MNNILKFFLWIAKTFEDRLGKPSSRKISAFSLIGVAILSVAFYHFLLYGYASGKFAVNEYTVIILDANYAMVLLLLSIVLLLFGVITIEALVSLVRGNKTNVIIESKKETTTTNETTIENPAPPTVS